MCAQPFVFTSNEMCSAVIRGRAEVGERRGRRERKGVEGDERRG